MAFEHNDASEEQTKLESGQEVKSAAQSAAVFEEQSESQPDLFAESDPFDVDEEYAAEVAVPADQGIDRTSDRNQGETNTLNQERDTAAGKTMMGWFALALAIASLFVWPAILGPGAVLFGFVAWSQGSRTLGVWSIVLGIISFVAYLAVAPIFG